MTTWQGKNVLVTGAASGIGLEVWTRLTGLGATVIRLDRTAPGNAEDTFVTVDVTDGPATQDAITRALAPLDCLDALINCAGIGASGGIGDNDDEEWKHVLDVNVIGTVRVSRAALPALLKSPAAAIVNVSSIAAWAGLPQRALYSASKGAVQALTLASAADLVGQVRVNCVCPGTVDTPWVGRLLDNATDAAQERLRLEARQPMGRLATAGEVAASIIWLASEQASFVTGTALAVDGGMAGLRLPPRN